ncbi:nucleotidyltransferase domain-containing protein [Mycetocola sp.]
MRASEHGSPGGWAVDAVVGRQTRPHQNLDLAVDAG